MLAAKSRLQLANGSFCLMFWFCCVVLLVFCFLVAFCCLVLFLCSRHTHFFFFSLLTSSPVFPKLEKRKREKRKREKKKDVVCRFRCGFWCPGFFVVAKKKKIGLSSAPSFVRWGWGKKRKERQTNIVSPFCWVLVSSAPLSWFLSWGVPLRCSLFSLRLPFRSLLPFVLFFLLFFDLGVPGLFFLSFSDWLTD